MYNACIELQLAVKMTTIPVTLEPARPSHKRPPDNKHKNRGRKPDNKGRHDLTTRSWMDAKGSDPTELDQWGGTMPPWVVGSSASAIHRWSLTGWVVAFVPILVFALRLWSKVGCQMFSVF